jgi:hypothetical protein
VMSRAAPMGVETKCNPGGKARKSGFTG